MPHTQTPHLRIYHERAGSGPRLLYISGTGGDLRAKPGIFDSNLPSQFDLLAYDQRGLGRSERPLGPYSMQDYADDVAALLDAVAWERCRVLGVSFGGMVAQEFALRHPERVERMVLACTSPGGAGGSSYPLHELQDLPLEDRARRMIAPWSKRFLTKPSFVTWALPSMASPTSFPRSMHGWGTTSIFTARRRVACCARYEKGFRCA